MARLLYLIVRSGDLERHPTRDAYIISGTVLRKAIERAATSSAASEIEAQLSTQRLAEILKDVYTGAVGEALARELGLDRPSVRCIIIDEE